MRQRERNVAVRSVSRHDLAPTPRMMQAVTAGLVLVAFVARLLMAAVPMASPASAGAVVLVPICTAEGIRWIDLDAQSPVKPAKPGFTCPLCFAAQGLAVLLPIADAPRRIVTLEVAAPVFLRDALVSRIAARPPPGRGPPSLSNRETLLRSL